MHSIDRNNITAAIRVGLTIGGAKYCTGMTLMRAEMSELCKRFRYNGVMTTT